MTRCAWCTADPLYQAYHDHEWGVPQYEPQHLFEMLLLEGFQAGLSWLTVLKKRERYRQVLHGFDPRRLALLSDDEINALMADPGIIRNRLKLNAVRKNAQAWLRQDDPVGFLWSFVGGVPQVNHFVTHQDVPAVTDAAQVMSRALKKAGFTFVGPTICYAFMQACGMVMDHTLACDRYAALSGGSS